MSAPSGPIQVIPAGFLGLLQLKNLGRLPDTLMGSVQPTVDMLEMWLRATLTAGLPSGTHALAGPAFAGYTPFTGVAIIVPDSEWWYVESFSVRTDTIGAGETIQGLAPAIQWNVGGGVKYATLGPLTALVTGTAAGTQAISTSKPFWAPPGAQLGFWCESAVGAFALTGDVYRAVLPV